MIRVLEHMDKVRWDAYVHTASDASTYHLSGWQSVIEKSFGHKTYYLFAEDQQGEITGLLPLVHLKSVLFGSFLVSLPYFNYGGLCASRNDVSNSLLTEAIQIAKSVRADHIELRHAHPLIGDLQVKTAKVSMRLQLPDDVDDLWKSFPAKLRSQVQRPMREGMYARLGREEALDDFYAVFSENMRDLGTPVYAKEFFRNILREFPKTSWICTVCTKQREPVASGFLVGFKDIMEIPWASSLRSHNRYSPNMLLYWSVLQLALEKGYGLFDFGRSTPGEGTYKFKEQWGAKPFQLYWHYWMQNGKPMPELNPKNPRYRLAIKTWQKLPVALTRVIGPAIVKNLP